MKYLLPLCLLFCAVNVFAQPSGSCVTGTFQIYNNVRWECQNSTWIIPGVQSITLPDSTTTSSPYMSGIAFSATTPLAANGVWSTVGKTGANANGFFLIKGFPSAATTSLSDQPFTIAYDYSNDGVTIAETINASYTSVNESRVAQFSNRSFQYLRITVTNGATLMASFMFALSLNTTHGSTASSIKTGVGAANVAAVTKSLLYGEDSTAANTFATLKQTAGALNTTITNTPAVTISGTVPVSGALTDAQLRASAVPVTVGNFPATQPVSGSVTATISGTPAVIISEPVKTALQRTGTLVTTATTADQVVLTYTVTAGKTLYLQSVSLQGSLTAISATASVMGVISLERPSGTKVVSFRAVNPTVSIAPLFVSEQSIPIPAGTVIRVVVTPAAVTSITWIANLSGYEQ